MLATSAITIFIGDTELTLDLKTYLQSVICTQACSAYILDLKNYERLVVRRNKPTMDLIRQLAQLKMTCRMGRRTNHDHIPLLRTLLYRMQCMDRDKDKPRGRKTPMSSSSGSGGANYQYDVVPHRGALIDLHGPGTVFHRNKKREQAKKKKGMFLRGAMTGGLGMVGQAASPHENSGGKGGLANSAGYYGGQNGVTSANGVVGNAFLTKAIVEESSENIDQGKAMCSK